MEIIVTHAGADFDALASMVAAKRIYPGARLVLPGSLNRNVRQFTALHGDLIDFADATELRHRQIKRMIVVDTRIAGRLGELAPLAHNKSVETFVFDHHQRSAEDLRPTRDFSEELGATATILTKVIRDRKIDISPFEATLFALGIHEDTGSLTYPSTTYDDAECLAYLMRKKASMDVINYFLNQTLSTEQHKLLNTFLTNAHTVDIRGLEVMFARARVESFVDGASIVTRKLGDLENMDVVFTFVEVRDRTYVIGRSRLPEVSVADVLVAFEGGGHPQAASAVVRGRKAQQLERELGAALGARVRVPLTAEDIMSHPVRTIPAGSTIKEAKRRLVRYGHTGLPVVEGGRLVGTISRRDIDKAAHHGLSHAPVRGFMSRSVVTVKPDRSIYELEELLSRADVARLPVLEGGKMVGIITRSDVLRAAHGGDYYAPSREQQEPVAFPRDEVLVKLETTLPGHVCAVLKEVGRLAEKKDVQAYLVGGIVRDVLLGVRNLDADIVVEGDGVAFARAVATRLKGRVRAHGRFNTAVVVLADGFRLDFASARSEFYEHPAALPEVEPGSVKQDLARRDFTINAMAVALNPMRFGELLDYVGGQRDLVERRVRVMHNLSFVEDPTRIFRAVRFEQRYDFAMDDQTEELCVKAVEMELVGELSGVRIRQELECILSEEEPMKAVARLDELGTLRGLHPGLKADREVRRVFQEIGRKLETLVPRMGRAPKRWIVYLLSLTAALGDSELVQWTDRMRFRKGDRQILLQGLALPAVEKRLSSAAKLKASEIYHLLHDLAPECLALMVVRTRQRVVRDRALLYLDDLRGVKMTLTGETLAGMGHRPSPGFGEVLSAVLDAKLDGRVTSADEEKALAEEVFKKLGGRTIPGAGRQALREVGPA